MRNEAGDYMIGWGRDGVPRSGHRVSSPGTCCAPTSLLLIQGVRKVRVHISLMSAWPPPDCLSSAVARVVYILLKERGRRLLFLVQTNYPSALLTFNFVALAGPRCSENL